MNQETPVAEQEPQQPEYLTREIPADEKDLILMVLDESLRLGRNYEFRYFAMNNVNHEALQRTTFLSNTISDKKVLFQSLDQRSYTYTRVLQTAKIALRKLQDDGEYNYYSADLIYKFIQLEEIFGEKNLKSVGVKWIEAQEKALKDKQPTEQQMVVHVDEQGEPVYLKPNVSGKRLKQQKKRAQQQAELDGAFNELSFDESDEVVPEDPDIDMDAESKADISNLNFD